MDTTVDVQLIHVDDVRELPALFLPLPENWKEFLDKVRRLTNLKLGGVYLYEIQYGKRTWRIRCVEVIDETNISQTDTMGETNETI